MNELKELILDKLRGYVNSQKRAYIVTLPSHRYPSGKFHNGIVIDVNYKRILFLDDFDGPIEIQIPLISSPDDIADSNKDPERFV